MNGQAESREIIPAGRQPYGWEHLIPIAKLLIERGHRPLRRKNRHGFTSTPGGTICRLTRRITEEDWEAINQRFDLPDNIVFFHGLIRDNANRVDFLGAEEISTSDGVMTPDQWEERERRAGRL